jgi:hypothetical protein
MAASARLSGRPTLPPRRADRVRFACTAASFVFCLWSSYNRNPSAYLSQ